MFNLCNHCPMKLSHSPAPKILNYYSPSSQPTSPQLSQHGYRLKSFGFLGWGAELG